MSAGVLLYGPPAVGKDTVTSELSRHGPFALFRRLKCGPGRSASYRMISSTGLAQLPPDDLLYVNRRYGATYAVDRSGLDEVWRAGLIPVVHLGQPEAVQAVIDRTAPDAHWLVVELHSPLAVLATRISERRTGDDGARLSAARSTPRLARPDLSIDTSSTLPEQAARLIAGRMSIARL